MVTLSQGVNTVPKQTFFNLDPERRQGVIAAAVEEFARHPYEQASLSRIVENCGIAKGSMYQYFEDKLDLYLYIVEMAYERKRDYVGRAFALEEDIFSVLEEYYRQSFLFSQDFPLLHQVANNFWSSRAGVLRGELEEGRLSRAEEFTEFLSHALQSGRANAHLDEEAVFFVYHAVGKALIDYFDEGMNDRFVTKVLDVLRYGLQQRGAKECSKN